MLCMLSLCAVLAASTVLAFGLCRPECARSDWERHRPICNTLRRIQRAAHTGAVTSDAQQG